MQLKNFKYSKYYELLFPFYDYLSLIQWLFKEKTPPTPPVIKLKLIKTMARKYSTKTFIETGTYLGTTTASVKKNFSKIYTIELDEKLYKRAKYKFRKNRNIIVLKGNSAKVLPKILTKINTPCLFWLDAHYSKGITVKGDKETPIVDELRSILKHKIKNHVILIDDARNFTGSFGYPKVSQLKKMIKNKPYELSIKDDIITIKTPEKTLLFS